MQSIRIKNTLPNIFSDIETTSSQIWLTDAIFEKGKNYLVAAESGTGKSSLCSYIYGVRNDYSGEILFDNNNITSFNIGKWCEIRKKSIAYLPQDLKLFPELSAIDNILLKNQLTNFKSEKDILQLFSSLGIPEKVNSPVGKLSVGQQQRVAIIRTLCQPCDFFLLDEPVSHLDERNNNIVSSIFMEEASKKGAGIITTSVGNHLLINIDKEYKL